MSQEKIVKYCANKKKNNDYEKLREKYKNDFNSFINKMENGNNTIHFRTTDARERM